MLSSQDIHITMEKDEFNTRIRMFICVCLFNYQRFVYLLFSSKSYQWLFHQVVGQNLQLKRLRGDDIKVHPFFVRDLGSKYSK